MLKYRIAQLNVAMDVRYEATLRQGEAYRYDFDGEPDFEIPAVSDGEIEAIRAKNPLISPNICEYMQTGSMFYAQLLRHDGMLLHASAVAYSGDAYLFSGPCGIGKSTHARMWRKCFGPENAVIINDDKPALRLMNDQIFVYGTPWSGKSRYNLNMRVPLAGIALLYRCETNVMTRADDPQAVHFLLNQTIRPPRRSSVETLLFLLDRVFESTPVYRFGLRADTEAAQLAYETMRPNKENRQEEAP